MKKSLSRKKDNRENLLRNQVTSLILYEEIKTTKAKASQVKPLVEHLLSRAKKNDLNSRRYLLSQLFDKKAVKKVFEVLVPRFKNEKSGFIKVFKVGPRLGDAAPMVILKLKAGEIMREEITKEKNDQTEERKTAPKQETGKIASSSQS